AAVPPGRSPAGAVADAALGTPPLVTPGHGLSAEAFLSDPFAVDDELNTAYAWDAGVAVGGFLRGLEEGRILGRACPSCDRVLVPPRMFCERCFRPTTRWVELPGTGVVQTFSICHVSWDMRPLEEPEIPAVIALDGSDGGLLHKLGEVRPEEVRIGMAVEPVWRPQAERAGSILDVLHFRPRGER
ncbi:MAG TPA: Zn-ribbon domain-containing OB-fold protein, partial [Actinomycetota bacterium]|nr:Zn-ribbon domain-containing OB-fold protein [Actinomycetota bacterium]